MMPFETSRSEQEVFDDLEVLCSTKGYIHMLAYISFRDHFIFYEREMTPEATAASYDTSRTVRTEFSTLLGLALKHPIDFSLPEPRQIQALLNKTHSLLNELHVCLGQPMFDALELACGAIADSTNPFLRGDVLREPIFYGGESAYSFQYRDFSRERYVKDDDWLLSNRGFNISDGHLVASALSQLQIRKMQETGNKLTKTELSEWTLLPGFTFSLGELAREADISPETTEAVLASLTAPDVPTNENFSTLDSFNIANAWPILRSETGDYISLQSFRVVEALYDSPFYWMIEDKDYTDTASKHRGEFTEQCVATRLASVFGEASVHKNVNVFDGKMRVCEVDVLVIFADRALVIQCKSKKLTLEARKGNDQQLEIDFKKAVQDAYDQAYLCSESLRDTTLKFAGEDGSNIVFQELKEIYPVCVVSDHYPALAIQARNFLKYKKDCVIQSPLVADVFLMDVIAEMLPTPLWFLNYINRRATFDQKIMSVNELTILAFHLQGNLWLEDDLDMMVLSDDIAIELDTAMTVRREGIEGDRTPKGILTRLEGTFLGRILKSIESCPEATLVDIGFMLLSLDAKALVDVNNGLEEMVGLAQKDGKNHDFTIGFEDNSAGLSVHCGSTSNTEALDELSYHCERRKYVHRSDNWYGLVVCSGNGLPRLGVSLRYPWKHDEAMKNATKDMQNKKMPQDKVSGNSDRKVGRNEPCPCGSGMKYKKCCI